MEMEKTRESEKREEPIKPAKNTQGSGDSNRICPVIQEAERLLELGQSYGRAMRRLRQSQKLCRKCPSQGQCPAMISLHGQIHAAIAAITEEWNLG